MRNTKSQTSHTTCRPVWQNHALRSLYLQPGIATCVSNQFSKQVLVIVLTELDACRYTDRKRCEKEARPGQGKPFCADHKCSDVDCQTLRSFSEVEGSLVMNAFCPDCEFLSDPISPFEFSNI